MHRARAARLRGFDSLPSLDPDPERSDRSYSVGSSKFKIGLRHAIKLIELYGVTKSEF
jgi:hypothetical protein